MRASFPLVRPAGFCVSVIEMRFDSSDIGQVMTEIVAYGTAVVVADVTSDIQRVGLS